MGKAGVMRGVQDVSFGHDELGIILALQMETSNKQMCI